MKKYEKIKVFFMGVISTLLLFILISASHNKNVIKAKEISLIDDKGIERIRLDATTAFPSLEIFDYKGNSVMELDGCPSLNFHKRNNHIFFGIKACLALEYKMNNKTRLQIHGYNALNYVWMYIYDENGKTVWGNGY